MAYLAYDQNTHGYALLVRPVYRVLFRLYFLFVLMYVLCTYVCLCSLDYVVVCCNVVRVFYDDVTRVKRYLCLSDRHGEWHDVILGRIDVSANRRKSTVNILLYSAVAESNNMDLVRAGTNSCSSSKPVRRWWATGQTTAATSHAYNEADRINIDRWIWLAMVNSADLVAENVCTHVNSHKGYKITLLTPEVYTWTRCFAWLRWKMNTSYD